MRLFHRRPTLQATLRQITETSDSELARTHAEQALASIHAAIYCHKLEGVKPPLTPLELRAKRAAEELVERRRWELRTS